ncbi:MAG: helix-hairpin-helix domain-containing protein, partial [Chloroflexota bacterium]|nr:helix-hairpin-helix domain-containing protein [Chloroflexota bacterium]
GIEAETTEPDVEATWVREFGKEAPLASAEVPSEMAELPSEAEAEEPKDEYAWISPESKEEKEKEEKKEKLELNSASLSQLEQLQGIGFRLAQGIIAYRQENGPFEKIEDLLNIPNVDAATIGDITNLIEVKAPKKAAPEPPISQVEPEDEYHAKQLDAQEQLKQGNIEEAMELYSKLVKKGKRVEQTIEALKDASYKHPVNAYILQTLGDAHMRADQLQEALDIYSKAEQLLR